MELPQGLAGALDGENGKKILLAAGAIAMLIIAALAYFFFFPGPSVGELTVKVSNAEGQPLWRAGVALSGISQDAAATADTRAPALTDRDGLAVFGGLPIGVEITVEVSGRGYKTVSKKVALEKASDSLEITLEPETTATTIARTLKFIGPNGESLSGKRLYVSLSCPDGAQIATPDREVTDGTLRAEAPAGCGTMVARVSGPGFESNNYNMQESGTIRLQALDVENGSAKISATDPENNFIDGIEVVIKDSHGVPTGDKKLTNFGDALFTLPPGSYSAFAYDPALRLAEDEQKFTVSANKTAAVKFSLLQRPAGAIKVRVLDARTGADINNARVIIESPSGKKSSRDYAGKELPAGIMERGISKISASANEYAPSPVLQIDSKGLSNAAYVLRLEKCTPSTCSLLRVNVLDEDGMPVQNARVSLIDSKSGFYMEEYGLRYSNYDGVAQFMSVKGGAYAALVQKFPAQGKSADFAFTQGTALEIIAPVTIGSGEIEISAVDSDGRPLPFALAQISTDYNRLGKLPLDSQGLGTFITKADKRVFVAIESNGYATFTSPAYQIYPSQKIAITATLQKQSLADSPKIDLLGLEDDSGKAVQSMAAGGSYRARLRLTMPSNRTFEQAGAFIRTGAEGTAGKDGIYIDAINAPGASVLKGAAYNEGAGIAQDNASITNGEAKWASILWDRGNSQLGSLEFYAQFRVRQSVSPGKALPVFYRAYGITGDGKFIRDPADSSLGEAESTGQKAGLYAKPYRKDFFEGSSEECTPQFCYSERVLDISQGLLLAAPYSLKVYSDYEFSFTLTNNSEAVHDKATLAVKNSSSGNFTDRKMRIKGYTIVNADSLATASSSPTFEISPVALGNLRRNKSVTGKFTLRGEAAGDTALQLQVASDMQVVFTKFAKVSVVREKDINVSVSPPTLPAFTEFDLNASAAFWSNPDDFLEIEGALVRVERITPDRVRTVFTATTDGMGLAGVHIPASAPGTKIIVSVEKAGYLGSTSRLEVSDRIISFKPSQVNFSLDLTSKTEEKQQLEATNLAPLPLQISGLRLGGKFRGLLDEARINNWLGQYVDKSELPYGSAVQIGVLSAISEDARRLDEPAIIDASLHIEVSNANRTITWPLEVPMKITINLAQPPKENGCLDVGLKEWKDATLGGNAEVEFPILNNCLTADGKPLALRNLKAQVQWKGNKYGNIGLHVQNPDTGQEASEVLSEGVFATLFDSVPAGKEMVALLTFTPKGGTTGQSAQFSVVLDAGQATNAGEQLVGASNPIESEIDIIDLAGCIKYTPDPEAGLVLQPEDDEGALEIDSSRCGNADIDFWLCKGDKGCSGGAEGGILVKPEQFHLSASSPKKKVQISRQEIPGLYGINVNIRTPRSNFREIAAVDALVKPAANDAFALRKYEFTLKGPGSKDSTELSNRLFVQNINVDASICDWGEASEKGWWNWTGAGVGLTLGALKGMAAANAAAHGATKGLFSTIWGKFTGAKAAQKAAAAATKASTATLGSICSEVTSAQSSVTSAQGPCAKTLAEPGVAGAIGPFETAVAQCEAAQSQAQALPQVDDSIDASLNIAMPAVGGAGGIATAASGIVSKQGAEAGMKVNLTAAATGLQAAATSLEAGETALAPQCAADAEGCAQCQSVLSQATAQAQAASAQMSSFIGEHFAESTAKTAASAAGVAGTQTAAVAAQTTLAPAVSTATTASAAFSPGTIFAAYTLGGFFVGGVLPGLFGQDPCAQRHSNDLPDYAINLLSDAGKIDSGEKKLSADYDATSARIIGNYKEQRIGVVFTNGGVSNPKPVYSTFAFNAKQHLHSNPTSISRGNSNFGPFNLPDRETLDVAAKLHLKFRTQEPEEALPPLEFDTLSCVSGNKIGRTGEKALPKVLLDWSFGENGIGKDSCLEQNPNGVYCDSAQFSIMVSKRLNALKEFFDRNPSFSCPANPLVTDLAKITKDLNISASGAAGTSGTAGGTAGPGNLGGAGANAAQNCYITDWTGYIEGEPAMRYLIEANEKGIQWTEGIPGKEAFMDTIHFNALLMQDGYTQDFMQDFARHYTSQRFFDTPDWFRSQLTDDPAGKKFGIGRLFETGNVLLTNRFFDSPRLSSAGTYDVLLNVQGEDGTYRFFRPDGAPNARITLETYLLQEPSPNSVFYSMPFDGLVGLDGDTFERQGYGVAFNNASTTEFVSINKDAQPVKTYNDSGSNPVATIDSGVEKRFYELNTSPSGRGSLLIAEKIGTERGRLSLRPSHATPVLLKASADTVSTQNLAAYYTVTSSEVPVDVGNAIAFWSGAGACLDPTGLAITEAFDERADRAAVSRDPVLNWQNAYAVDFGKTNYTGDAYIRTIFYTNPLEEVSLTAEQPNAKIQFLTADESGTKVKLSGVGGVPYNNASGGSIGSPQSVSDVFSLVRDGRVCVVDSGRKASFFWNPKAAYEMAGKERNISEFTNSLSAGQTCIGFG